MSKLRSLNTSFWSDPWIEILSPEEKLLFIYLITNEKTNMLGIYEVSTRKISFETGIKEGTISNALEAFEKVGKVKYKNNHVVLVNYMKHQKYNPNMKKAAIDVHNNLPNDMKIKGSNLSKSNPSEAFESLLNHYGMVSKVEDEVEEEEEDKTEEGKRKFTPPLSQEVFAYMKELNLQEKAAQTESEKFTNHFQSNGWKVGGRSKMKDWKAAVRNWVKRDFSDRKNSSKKPTENITVI
ncbi:hypothetical protein [uncultured Salegentibacter sp.]|uniref:hypothetical protein n=1 Tax=uncultured Salegentibacter sp. TaxID=259320 RepID=UPI002599703D|nr:hypothetical protein [uncultured Salegentibacter sp.]